MTPDERTALNEAVCKRLGWVLRPDGVWVADNSVAAWSIGAPDFTSDWNAVYRWIVPAVKEMEDRDRALFWTTIGIAVMLTRKEPYPWFLYATTEDYCRAFLAVTEVNDAR
jgi:hypothetical protein